MIGLRQKMFWKKPINVVWLPIPTSNIIAVYGYGRNLVI